MGLGYVAVLGCPRSGTTFLMSCLNVLPYTECLSGISFPVPVIHLIATQEFTNISQKCMDYALESTLNVYLDAYSGSRAKAIQHFLSGSLTFKELKEIFQRNHQIKRLVYKEPFFSFTPEFVYRALPECKIIYLIRDGRDCANSLVETYGSLTDEKLSSHRTSESPLGYFCKNQYIPWWVESSEADEFIQASEYVRSIWMWKEMVKRCDDFFSKRDVTLGSRVLQIKYEELVTQPIVIGQKITNFLDVDFDKRFIKRLRKASSSSIGKHKSRDQSELHSAEKLAHSELKMYGYIN
ncbi:sulfotransferase [Nodosilinea sp. AN01ver1]|uniref:sulfotransferase n=1 Tax=Nodosilinea sp. AN01ver1 TaxID=3423362 RepID=UPI003D3233A6